MKPKFEDGDVVRIKEEKMEAVENSFPGTAIFRGESTHTKIQDRRDYVALERMDGHHRGGAQNGWWNFRKSDLDCLELVDPASKVFDYPELGAYMYVGTRTAKRTEGYGLTVSNKKLTITQKMNIAFKKFVSADLQTQIKAGFRNDDLSLSSEGRAVISELVASGKPGDDYAALFSAAAAKVAEEKAEMGA